jgi:hypothetical protein
MGALWAAFLLEDVMDRLVDERLEQLGCWIEDPPDTTRLHWDISHAWITVDGNWDDVPEWAKPFQNDNLGGATHGFMLGIGTDGERDQQEKLFVQGWPDGYATFSPLPEHDWWGNCLLTAGFNWKETTGPYWLQANAISSAKLCGVGLPWPPLPWQPSGVLAQGGCHVSFFVVMQETEPYEPGNGNGGGGGTPIPPMLEDFERVLTKAETAGDSLVGGNMHYEAAEVYLNIASLLVSMAALNAGE